MRFWSLRYGLGLFPFDAALGWQDWGSSRRTVRQPERALRNLDRRALVKGERARRDSDSPRTVSARPDEQKRRLIVNHPNPPTPMPESEFTGGDVTSSEIVGR